jgi:hypothetical protein
MNEYHRTITDFLSGHGAHDVRLIPGGKHPKVTFEFRGKRIERSVSASPSDVNAANSAIRDLKKMLGEPDIGPASVPRVIDDMTPRTNGPAKISTGGIALYGGVGDRLRMRLFPPADVVAFLGARVVRIQRMAKDQWLLTPTDEATGRRVRADGKKWQLDAGYGEELTRGYESPFGVSPAEYVVVDDHVVVRLLTDQIKQVEKRQPKRPKVTVTLTPMPGPIPENVLLISDTKSGAIEEANPIVSAEELRAAQRFFDPPPDPRSVLAAISKVEASTPYRLVRLKDDRGWAWQAPMIKLDGGC